MAIIDVITFNGEHDLFNLRYKILKDYVDEFIVFEFEKTFSGKPKRPYFLDSRPEYSKVTYHYIKEEQYEKYWELAESSPNTVGADHWKREFMQKESMKGYLTHLKDEDVVFIGDCDEIWNPAHAYFIDEPYKIELIVYTYWLNNLSSEKFWGTLVASYKDIKNACLNHLRSNSLKELSGTSGWHFTSLKDSLAKKLEDSYTKETYATDTVMQNLQSNIEANRDFLGRNFTFRVDESEWPQYLKDNRELYKHLLK